MLIDIPEGTVIIREGEANMDMYKILSGQAEIYSGYGTDHETILGIKSKDDYFGEMGLLTKGKPAVYTVVAFSDMVLRRITASDIDKFIMENHTDVYNIMRHMAESMYSLKYGMELYTKDLVEQSDKKDYDIKRLSGFVAKHLARSYGTAAPKTAAGSGTMDKKV